MKERFPHIAFLATVLAVLWLGDHEITPWIQRVGGYERIQNKDLSVLLGHWVFEQLPSVLVCVAVWLVGSRLGLMPSFRQSLALGVSGRRVAVTGLYASAILLLLTFAIGAVAGGTFGFHPYFPKMAGDLVSNMYEEIVFRGLLFCAFYGVAAAASFSLEGRLNRAGLITGTIGSCIAFAIGHQQYSVALRVAIGVVSVFFVYPWVATRSLWAPWIPHMLVDVIGDSILKL